MKKDVQLLKIIVDFLSRLSDEQIDDLLTKNARLKLEPIAPKSTAQPTDEHYPSADICTQINALTSREDAEAFFSAKAFAKKDLTSIAKAYDVPITTKDTKDRIIQKIIEMLIGSKLRFDALLTTELDNK